MEFYRALIILHFFFIYPEVQSANENRAYQNKGYDTHNNDENGHLRESFLELRCRVYHVVNKDIQQPKALAEIGYILSETFFVRLRVQEDHL